MMARVAVAKLAVVVGATSGQGGSVVRALLQQPGSYKIRGLTKNATSEAAEALKAQGVEMVEYDIDNEASIVAAFEGASYIFAMTDYFDVFKTKSAPESMAAEYRRGVNLAKAASQTSTLKHYIWSTLSNSKALSQGKVEVPHTDGKSEVDEYIKKDPVLLSKTTFLWVGIFLEMMMYPMLVPNLLGSAGKYISLQPCAPDTPLEVIGNHRVNVGVFVAAVLAKPELTLGGKYVLASIGTVTVADMLKQWSMVTGKDVVSIQIAFQEYETLWPKVGSEVGANLMLFDLCREKSWSSQDYLSADALGLSSNDFEGAEESLRSLDWSSIS